MAESVLVFQIMRFTVRLFFPFPFILAEKPKSTGFREIFYIISGLSNNKHT